MSELALYLPLSREELIAEVERFRAKLQELAGECADCTGTGTRRAIFTRPGCTAISKEPCAGCQDIREALNCDRHPYR